MTKEEEYKELQEYFLGLTDKALIRRLCIAMMLLNLEYGYHTPKQNDEQLGMVFDKEKL